MSMPPLFTCIVCDGAVDPKSALALRLATVWLRSSGKTVDTIETEMYRYRHNYCVLGENFQQDSLF